jgi:glyoxylase-like metal-dependent hydrolase (beta-lactamase superfamily II)
MGFINLLSTEIDNMADVGLVGVLGKSFYCTGRLSIGVYLNDKTSRAVLIDSGLDNDTAKKVDKSINSAGYSVAAIINTHGHADHCGGNNYFQKKYQDLRIYAAAFEAHFIQEPFLEPLCFCAGAAPFKELRTKILEANASTVTNVIHYSDAEASIDGMNFEILALPGHTPGMIAVRTPDNVLYCGDAIFGEETIEKHPVLFYTDISKTLDSLEKLRSAKANGYVLYHGGGKDDIASLIDKHQAALETVSNAVLDTIKETEPSLEALTQKVIEKYGIESTVVQHVLTDTCVRAYVSKLQQDGKIVLEAQGGLLRIKKAGDV